LLPLDCIDPLKVNIENFHLFTHADTCHCKEYLSNDHTRTCATGAKCAKQVIEQGYNQQNFGVI